MFAVVYHYGRQGHDMCPSENVTHGKSHDVVRQRRDARRRIHVEVTRQRLSPQLELLRQLLRGLPLILCRFLPRRELLVPRISADGGTLRLETKNLLDDHGESARPDKTADNVASTGDDVSDTLGQRRRGHRQRRPGFEFVDFGVRRERSGAAPVREEEGATCLFGERFVEDVAVPEHPRAGFVVHLTLAL
jgi:hypothetical protein